MIKRRTIDGKIWLEAIRAPRLKVLRAHLFGLMTGIVTLLVHLLFASAGQRGFTLLVAWFLVGYIFGVVLALSYNYLSYLFLKICHPEWLKLWFYYRPDKVVNVIKTPTPQKDWDTTTQQLYNDAPYKVFDFQPYPELCHPYTIVFVANPLIETRESTRDDPQCQRDPILGNDNLFLKAVERALFSFEFNEVVGRPDILSKLRIITVNPASDFDGLPTTASPCESHINAALVGEFRGSFEAAREERDKVSAAPIPLGTFADRMLRPSVRAANFVRQALDDAGFSQIEHVDVIFMISASETYDMSTADPASFSDWSKVDEGENFTFSIDPYCQKGDEVLKNHCECVLCKGKSPREKELEGCSTLKRIHRINGPDRLMVHELLPSDELMGKVAMSAYDARTKLPIHEFAHAMSSQQNGLVVDEYFDYALISEKNDIPEEPSPPSDCPNKPEVKGDPEYPNVGILVNRIYRNPELMRDRHRIKVHNLFARYNGYVYESDRQHHSDQQGWFSYFPERRQREVLCTMDAAPDVFEFDELLRDFIYDRLWAKVNRSFVSKK